VNNLEALKERQAQFHKYTASMNRDDIATWKSLKTEPYKDENGRIISPYYTMFETGMNFILTNVGCTDSWFNAIFAGPPTQMKAYEALVDAERQKLHAQGESLSGLPLVINTALEIEKEQ
jgi:hypothetical protein